MDKQELIDTISKTAQALCIDENLAISIAMVESGCDWPRASSRFEPAFKWFLFPETFAPQCGVTVDTERVHQATSWGPMHIMGAVARELGFRGALPELFSPEVGVLWACRKLQKLGAKYESDAAVIAAYNAGTPRLRLDGKFENQDYVDRVLERLQKLKRIG